MLALKFIYKTFYKLQMSFTTFLKKFYSKF